MTDPQPIHPDAWPTVVGIVSARSRNAVGDASALMSSFITDMMDSGHSETTAYRTLCTAALILLEEQTNALARYRRQTPGQAILQLSAEVCVRHPVSP